MDMNYFKEKNRRSQVCYVLAINSGFRPSRVEGQILYGTLAVSILTTTKASHAHLYADCQTPYRYVEHLIDVGLKIAKSKLDSGNFDIAVLMEN